MALQFQMSSRQRLTNRNDSRLAFNFMASLATRIRALVELELARFGATAQSNYLALDYIPPIFLEAGAQLNVALISKVAYVDGYTTFQNKIILIRSQVRCEDVLSMNQATLTQLAYQLIRMVRSEVDKLGQPKLIQLGHNESLTSSTGPSGQRIKV